MSARAPRAFGEYALNRSWEGFFVDGLSRNSIEPSVESRDEQLPCHLSESSAGFPGAHHVGRNRFVPCTALLWFPFIVRVLARNTTAALPFAMDDLLTHPDDFPTLFCTMQRAVFLARRMAAAGRDGNELGKLLLHSRRLLIVMRQHADLAPADARDSLVELCNAADQHLRKLERPAATRAIVAH